MKKVLKKILNLFKRIIKYIILFFAWLFMPNKNKPSYSKYIKTETKSEIKNEDKKEQINSTNDNITIPDEPNSLEHLTLNDLYTQKTEDEYKDELLIPIIYRCYEKIYDIKLKKLEKNEMKIVEEYTIKYLPAIKRELPKHVIKDEKYLEYRLKPIVEKQLEKEPLTKEENNKVFFITPKEKKLIETQNIKPKAKRIEKQTIEENKTININPVNKDIVINKEKKLEQNTVSKVETKTESIITEDTTKEEVKPKQITTTLSLKDEIINAIAIGTVILANIDNTLRTTNNDKNIKEKIKNNNSKEIEKEEAIITEQNKPLIEEIKEKIQEEIKQKNIEKDIKNNKNEKNLLTKQEQSIEAKINQENDEQQITNTVPTIAIKELITNEESKKTDQEIINNQKKLEEEIKLQEEKTKAEENIEQIEKRIEKYERENPIKILDYTYHVEKDIKNEVIKEDIEDRNYEAVEEQINKILDNIENFIIINEKKLTPKQKESLEYQKQKLQNLKQRLNEQKNIDLKNEEIALEEIITEQEIDGIKKQINNIDEDKKEDYKEHNIEKPEELSKLEFNKKKDVEKKLIKKQLRKSYRVISITSILFFPFIKNKFFFFYTKNKLIQKHLFNISEIIHNKTINPQSVDEDQLHNGESALNESINLAYDNLKSADILYQETIEKYPELEYDSEFKSYYSALRYRLVKTYKKLDRKSLFFQKHLSKYKGKQKKLIKTI